MADIFTKAQRSRIMSRIRSKDTKPELIVRRLLHRMGYRYRLHDRRLPGCPDLSFPRLRKVLFVNGCWWHLHRCLRGGRMPTSRRAYWRAKLEGNRRRDRRKRRSLRRLGWKAMTVWECQLQGKRLDRTIERVVGFLERRGRRSA